MRKLRETVDVHAFAHVTGGGLPDNLARVLPGHCDAVLHRGTWEEPRIFAEIQAAGDVPDDEMTARVQPRPRDAGRCRTGEPLRYAGFGAVGRPRSVGGRRGVRWSRTGKYHRLNRGRITRAEGHGSCYSAHTGPIPPRSPGEDPYRLRGPHAPEPRSRARTTAHPVGSRRHVPGEPQDGHPLGARRQDLRHPHPRRPPPLPAPRRSASSWSRSTRPTSSSDLGVRSGRRYDCDRNRLTSMVACAFIPAALGWNMNAEEAGTSPSTQRRAGAAQASCPLGA